jgi:hypothetical protein
MANSRSSVPQMTSDGKRMRVLWKSGDGDGDSSTYLVERSINILKGHPTWKVFMGDIDLPIERGSKNEPPHYVYLDDRACYYIYLSNVYSKDELKMFWPFDFSNQGQIKQGRKNRGRVAYLDDSSVKIAKGPLRGKEKWYEFSGNPEVVAYYAIRPKKGHMERQVAEELAKNGQLSAEDVFQGLIDDGDKTSQASEAATSPATTPAEAPVPIINTPRLSRPTSQIPRPPPKGVPLEVAEVLHPTKLAPRRPIVPVQNIDDMYPPMPTGRPTPSPASSVNTLYPSRSAPPTSIITPLQFGSTLLTSSFRSDTLFRYSPKMIPKPVALPPRAIHGSPYGTVSPVSKFRSTPRAISGDLSSPLGSSLPLPSVELPASKRNLSRRNATIVEASKTATNEVPEPVTKEPTKHTTPTMKRTFVMPLDISSSDIDSSPNTPSTKRLRLAPSSASVTNKKPNFGSDGANDDHMEIVNLLSRYSDKLPLQERSKTFQLKA